MKIVLLVLKSVCSLLAIAAGFYLIAAAIAGMISYNSQEVLSEVYNAVGTFSAALLAVASGICALLVGVSVWTRRFHRVCAILAIAAIMLALFAFVSQPSHSYFCETQLFVLCVDSFWLVKFRYLYSALAIAIAMILAGSTLVLERRLLRI